MLAPLQLHNMLVEPDPAQQEQDNKALIDLALEPGEEAAQAQQAAPSALEDAADIAEDRYAQQQLNRRANIATHQKAQP